MGQSMARKMNSASIIPQDLRLFEVTDIPKYFHYLKTTFHLSSKWEKHYQQSLLKVERGVGELEFFFSFLKQNLEPALKVLLQREDVIFAIARYLIKDRINEKRQEQNELKEFYRSDKWKER